MNAIEGNEKMLDDGLTNVHVPRADAEPVVKPKKKALRAPKLTVDLLVVGKIFPDSTMKQATLPS